MASYGAIRDGLATRLATISGLRAHDVWPDTVNPPCAIVMPPQEGDLADYDQTFGGNDTLWRFEVLVLVQTGTIRAAQDELDQYLSNTGTKSIRVAIYGDETLGGLAEFCQVRGVRDYGGKDLQGGRYFGAVVLVDVWAR